MPADQTEQDLKARMWSAAIYDTITYAEAQQIIITHYQTSNDVIGVADINHPRRTPLPPGYYANDELAAGVGIKHTAVDPAPPSPSADPCPTCARRYIHAAICQHSGLVAS